MRALQLTAIMSRECGGQARASARMCMHLQGCGNSGTGQVQVVCPAHGVLAVGWAVVGVLDYPAVSIALTDRFHTYCSTTKAPHPCIGAYIARSSAALRLRPLAIPSDLNGCLDSDEPQWLKLQ